LIFLGNTHIKLHKYILNKLIIFLELINISKKLKISV